jgi:membrane protease YdiL (CAAX protease family)
MTAAASPTGVPAPAVARPAAAAAVMAAVLGVFVARPLLVGMGPLTVLFAVLLVVGLGWPVTAEDSRGRVPLALTVGTAAFALGRLLGGGEAPVALGSAQLPALALAAVAEELFFRRFVYAVLRPGGATVAVVGTSLLFAVAHVTVYGWWVLPLDLAAGLILSWQRWASGTWAVPALTHVIANALVVF